MKQPILALILLIAALKIGAQPTSPLPYHLTHQLWQCNWIAPANVRLYDYGVYHFRKNFDLTEKPQSCIVHVSADNRYKLYVNGKYLGNGPARSNINHWQYETYDIAPYLQTGKNVVAALVWNMGEHKPLAQLSAQTGFFLQSNDAAFAFLNSNKSWLATPSTAYSPTSTDNGSRLRTYIVVGCGDHFEAKKHVWNYPILTTARGKRHDNLNDLFPLALGRGQLGMLSRVGFRRWRKKWNVLVKFAALNLLNLLKI
jgi:alpha-L-rhamnosidase